MCKSCYSSIAVCFVCVFVCTVMCICSVSNCTSDVCLEKCICPHIGPVHPDSSGTAGAQPVWRDWDHSVWAPQYTEHAQTEKLWQWTHLNGGGVWGMALCYLP